MNANLQNYFNNGQRLETVGKKTVCFTCKLAWVVIKLDLLTFDITKAEAGGRKIRSESNKLKSLSNKLKNAVDNTPSWWSGDSRNGFKRQADELVGLMNKTVDLIADLGEDMLTIAKAKREEEERLKKELEDAVSVERATVSATAAGSGGYKPGTAEYNATGEYPDKSEFSIGGGYEKDIKEPTKWHYNPETEEFEKGRDELWPEGKSVLSAEYGYSDSIAYAGAEAYGKNDYAEGSAGIYVGYAEGHMGAGAGLYAYDKDGNKVLAPGAHAEIGGSVSAIYGEAQGKIGTDWIGAYGGIEGSAGKVGAEAGASVGVFRNETGGYTVDAHVGASAEAIAVEAKGQIGGTVLGIDMGLTGGVNVGVGAHADVGFKDGKFKFDVGASLGVGASIGFEVDVGKAVDAVVAPAKAVWNWLFGG